MDVAIYRIRAVMVTGGAMALVCLMLCGCSSDKGAATPDKAAADTADKDAKAATQPVSATAPPAEKPHEKKPLIEQDTVPPPTLVGEVTVEELYPDKKLQIRRKVKRYSDNTLINHGQFTSYYQNGQKLEEGQYIDAKKDGPWHLWYDNGQEAKVENYVDGKLDGKWTLANKSGVRETDVSFKAGKRDGRWITYGDDGKQIVDQKEYQDNKLHGTNISWYPDGKKERETHFENGVPNGLQQQWFKNGQLAMQAEYKNGKLNGKNSRWNEKGEKLLEEEYADGKLLQKKSSSGG